MIRAIHCTLAAALALAAGCADPGPKVVPVRGKVTYNGNPVTSGTVTFTPTAGGPPATGEIGPDGTFAMTTFKSGDGAVPGKHKVFIAAMAGPNDQLPESRSPTPPPTIPVKYTHPATSPLTADVGDTETAVTFELTGPLK
ncbi:MAG: hypothetical protein J0I06_06285 [Planctomycetes bacterium]|nr:hypothetical protein [Planctomycetota bacterium]